MSDEAPPPAFTCAVCQRLVEPTPWRWQWREHRPPVCNWCTGEAPKTRVPGMTRGDHRQLQRLFVLADQLNVEAYRREHPWY